MKSQDIFLLFRMASLHAQEERFPMADKGAVPIMTDVSGFMEDALAIDHLGGPHPGIPSIPEAIALEPYSNWGMFSSTLSQWGEEGLEGWVGWDDPGADPPITSWVKVCCPDCYCALRKFLHRIAQDDSRSDDFEHH